MVTRPPAPGNDNVTRHHLHVCWDVLTLLFCRRLREQNPGAETAGAQAAGAREAAEAGQGDISR